MPFSNESERLGQLRLPSRVDIISLPDIQGVLDEALREVLLAQEAMVERALANRLREIIAEHVADPDTATALYSAIHDFLTLTVVQRFPYLVPVAERGSRDPQDS